MEFFKKQATTPDDIPDTVFASIGRTVLLDLGTTTFAFRLLSKMIDANFLAFIITRTIHWMPDYKRNADK